MVYRTRRYGKRYPRAPYVKRAYVPRAKRMALVRNRKVGGYKTASLSQATSATFPSSLLTKFNYTDSKLFTPLSGSATDNVYSAVSLYDPDATGAGTGVLFYDRLINANLYRFYKVYGCKATITMVNESNFPTCVQIAYGPRATLTNILAPNPGVIDTYTTNKNNFIVNLGASTGANSMRKIKLWIDPAKVLGKTRQAYMADTDFNHAYNNSVVPIDSRQVDFFINVMGGLPAATPVAPSVSVTVHIQYFARISEFGQDTVQT